jgi:hypothetical protein
MKLPFAIFAFLFCSLSCFSTHLKGGYVSVRHDNGNKYIITVTVFTNTGWPVLFGGEDDKLDFGDGTFVLVPETNSSTIGDGLGIATFTIDHTYAAPGTYAITYREPNRDAGIINIPNSAATRFGLKSILTIDPFLPEYNSPDILTAPIFRAPIGSELSASILTGDPNGLTLYYYKQTPLEAVGYVLPKNFNVNPINGLISWDTKFNNTYTVGEYAFSINILSVSDGYTVGSMNVDLQVTLEETPDHLSLTTDLSDLNNRIFVPTEGEKKVKVFFNNTADASLSLSVYSEINESIILTTYDSIHDNENILVGLLTIKNPSPIDRSEPYIILVRGRSENTLTLFKDLPVLFFPRDTDKPELVTAQENAPSENDTFIYPNPFEEYLMVNYPGNVRLILYSVNGIPVFDQVIKGQSKLFLGGLSGKEFVYHIVTDGNAKQGKILKK